LADTVAYAERHNEANGERNRDGHDENFSWNNGVEGASDDAVVNARRAADLRALLGTLFASTGTILLAAGDEFGRAQGGNNNAYAQDNATTWIDWDTRDHDLQAFVAEWSQWRTNTGLHAQFPTSAKWLNLQGHEMRDDLWEDPHAAGFRLEVPGEQSFGAAVDRAGRSVRHYRPETTSV
jgi:glycogen operon protein